MSEPQIDLVRKAARLARLEITDAEARSLGRDFGRILEHFQVLAALDVDGVEPTSGASGLRDVLRPDLPRTSSAAECLLAGAPAREDGFYRVPKTIREE